MPPSDFHTNPESIELPEGAESSHDAGIGGGGVARREAKEFAEVYGNNVDIGTCYFRNDVLTGKSSPINTT